MLHCHNTECHYTESTRLRAACSAPGCLLMRRAAVLLVHQNAVHAYNFCCPYCGAKAKEAQAVWINRRAPVLGEDSRRKWQEFYHCQCDRVWWAWSSDRPAENK